MSTTRANVEITASSSRLAAGLSAAAAKFQEFSGTVARGIGKAFKGINKHLEPGETMKSAAGHFLGGLAERGLDTVTDQANQVRDFERSLVRYQIVANKTPAVMNEMRRSINEASKATGVDRAVVLAGAQAYLDITGDVEGASREMKEFARIAQASDSQMSDVATAAAAMQDSMKLDPSLFESTFSGLINQGKAGAVTLKDFAGELNSMLPQFARFGVIGREGVIQVGAMFQVVRKGFKDASEAGTGMMGLMKGLKLHADKFEKAGVKIFNVDKDGVKHFRHMSDILDDIGKSKLAKDPQMLAKAFGRGEGEQAYVMLASHVDMLREMERAGEDAGTVERDLNTFMISDAGRLDAAMNRLKVSIAEAFTPERITGFVNAVESLADKMQPVIDGVGKIGDAFGALYGVGQSIRGYLSGNDNSNPFKKDVDTDRQVLEFQRGRGLKVDVGREKHLELSKKNSEAYDKAVGDILAAEVNERTSPESIKRAVIASMSGNEAGALGAQRAGSTYLGNAGITPEKAHEIYAKAMGDALRDAGVPKIIQAIREGFEKSDGPTVKIGDNQVARAHAKATDPRRRTH